MQRKYDLQNLRVQNALLCDLDILCWEDNKPDSVLDRNLSLSDVWSLRSFFHDCPSLILT